MDFNDAIKTLTTQNPDCNQSDIRIMLDSQIEIESARLKQLPGRNKYEQAVKAALARMQDWFATGDEFAVSLNWKDLISFATHCPACIYCVFVAKSRKAAKEEFGHRNMGEARFHL